jgi:hypothetical protein
MKNKTRKNNLPFFIPRHLHIDTLLFRHPPVINHYKKEKLIYLLHLINDIPSRSDDVMVANYTPLHTPILKKTIGNNYKEYLDYLVCWDIIETDGMPFNPKLVS